MNTFSVAEFSELNALLRAILAGKFSKSPMDLDVLDSKIVAKQVIQLADMVDACFLDKIEPGGHAEYRKWRHLTPDRDEWAIALENAKQKHSKRWETLSQADQYVVARAILAPYETSQTNLELFCTAISR